MKDNIIQFLKTKDFKFISELGRGSCGKTVLLYDEVIEETFVCKKYEPFYEEHKEELFGNFIQEIKLLYMLNHKNIVRVFNYYIYPKHLTGYILMENIEGNDFKSYLADNPQNINDIFRQCLSGFLHLEKCNILHRDIRPANILVSNNGELKIIDFGFGKKIINSEDFDKSISLNLWCDPPLDFSKQQYDFTTEIYFVGKLFEKSIIDQNISTFKYPELLSKMCNSEPSKRFSTFSEINNIIFEEKFFETEFHEHELSAYREFSKNLSEIVIQISDDCTYYEDSELVQKN